MSESIIQIAVQSLAVLAVGVAGYLIGRTTKDEDVPKKKKEARA